MNRRTLLKGLIAGGATLPFLPRIPSAQSAPPKRLVIFHTPNGSIDRAHWLPTGSGPAFTLPASLPSMMSALNPHRQKLLILGDMAMKSRATESKPGGHVGTGHVLTGRRVISTGSNEPEYTGSGISVDQYVARRLGTEALVLGAGQPTNAGNNRVSYKGAREPVTPIWNPRDAFTEVFGTAPESPDDDTAAAKRARAKSILDTVASSLSSYRERLPRDDWAKLERHLDAVRELETTLTTPPPPLRPSETCDPTQVPTASDFPLTGRRHIDVVAQAFACDVRRVATLQLGGSGGAEDFSGGINWPSEGISYPMSQHVIAHDYDQNRNATTIARREAIEAVYFRQLAYLMGKLDAIPEGDGTVLDNTLIFYCKGMGAKHSYEDDLLFMLAGRAGGALTSNRYLSRAGVAHNDLLVSLCNLMGLHDVETFGEPEFCDGPVSL